MISRPILPIVSDVQVGALTLRDRQSVSREDRSAITASYATLLQPRLDVVRPGTQWCGNIRTERDKYIGQMNDSGQSPQDFQAQNPFEVEDTSNLNPEAPILTFGVYTTDGEETLRGAFALYNIRIISETPDLIEIVAFPCPAFRANGNTNSFSLQWQIMAAIMENDLPIEGEPTRAIDLLAWDFPTSPGRQWLKDDESDYPPLAELRLRSHVLETVSILGVAVPKNIRRNDVSRSKIGLNGGDFVDARRSR